MDNTDINTLDNAVDTSAYSKSKINDAELRTTSEPPLPTGGKFWIAFATVSFGMFFSGYDGTCVTTITPIITDEFNSLNDVSWYGIAYSLTSCTTLLSYGKLYSYFAMKHVFMSALSIFLVGNIVCATAPSSIAFIIGRAICGFGNAGMLSGCTIIISRITSLRERPLYSSISGGIECIAIIIAPLLSGAITHSVDWRVCFYIIIPFVVIMLISTFLFVDVSNTAEQANLPTAEKIKQLDLPGMMIFTPLIVSFTLALQWGGTEYAWRDGRIIALLVIAGVFTIIFAIQQWRMKETATLSPPLLKERTVTFGCLFMFTTSGSGYVIDFYAPIFYQAILSKSTLQSGLLDLPRMLGLITSLLLAGTITTFIGYYTPTMLLGTILMSISSGLITTWSPQTSLPTIIGYNLLSGLGIGFAFQQPFIAVQTVLKQEHVPAGIVILQFAQYLGNIVALAGAQNLFIGKLMGGLRREVPEIDASLVLKTGALDLGKIIPEKYAVRVLKVYADALDWSFVVATVLACVTVFGALGMKWESIKKDEENGMAGDGEVRIE